MRRINGVTLCYGLSVLLFVSFIVSTLTDYSRYNRTLNSAPFYIWIVVNAIYFLLPAVIAFFIGVALKKKATGSLTIFGDTKPTCDGSYRSAFVLFR